MASDETMNFLSSMHEDDDVNEEEDHQHDHPHHHSLSRLSLCTSSIKLDDDDDDDDDVDDDVDVFDDDDDENDDDDVELNILSLSIEDGNSVVESCEGYADAELSDDKEGKEISGESDDSDKEKGCFSLPATPRRKTRHGFVSQPIQIKDYASEDDAKGRYRRKHTRKIRERWLEKAWEIKKYKNMEEEVEINSSNNNYLSGESECVVITKPKGGGRCMCMDMDEIKACRDLGFELQHQRMLEIPNRVSGSTIETSSGGNSPIANWRISSPGDDPRDVKARLRVWAQVVALASASSCLSG